MNPTFSGKLLQAFGFAGVIVGAVAVVQQNGNSDVVLALTGLFGTFAIWGRRIAREIASLV